MLFSNQIERQSWVTWSLWSVSIASSFRALLILGSKQAWSITYIAVHCNAGPLCKLWPCHCASESLCREEALLKLSSKHSKHLTLYKSSTPFPLNVTPVAFSTTNGNCFQLTISKTCLLDPPIFNTHLCFGHFHYLLSILFCCDN